MSIYQQNRLKLISNIEDRYGYLFCENCGKNVCGHKFEIHHIVFRSEAPNHEHLNDLRNLILLGSTCHKKFHSTKKNRNEIVKERNLEELFGRTLIIDK